MPPTSYTDRCHATAFAPIGSLAGTETCAVAAAKSGSSPASKFWSSVTHGGFYALRVCRTERREDIVRKLSKAFVHARFGGDLLFPRLRGSHQRGLCCTERPGVAGVDRRLSE